MKNLKKPVLLFCLLSIFVPSCKKNKGSTEKSVLTLSKSSIKRGEPLVATADELRPDLMIKWSVSPSSLSTWISASGNKSVILFSNPGSYVVSASYFLDSSAPAPYDSSSSPITVTDSIYNDSTIHCGVLHQVPIYSADQIFLTPVSYSDTGLVLLAHTQEIYDNHYPSLNSNTGSDSTVGYEFYFGSVTEYPCGNATSVPTPATAILSFGVLNNGTYNMTFVLNGNIYRGSLAVTSRDCSFIWNYSSGVLMSPLTIQKQ